MPAPILNSPISCPNSSGRPDLNALRVCWQDPTASVSTQLPQRFAYIEDARHSAASSLIGIIKIITMGHWPDDAKPGPLSSGPMRSTRTVVDTRVMPARTATQCYCRLDNPHQRRRSKLKFKPRLSPLGFDHINMRGRYAFILPDQIACGVFLTVLLREFD